VRWHADGHLREILDVFAVRDEISEAIATSLAGDVQRADCDRAARQPPEGCSSKGKGRPRSRRRGL